MGLLEEILLRTGRDENHLIERLIKIMATLDADVQAATAVIGDLVTALQAAGSGISAADQTALETAIAAGQAALTPPASTPAPPATDAPPPA